MADDIKPRKVKFPILSFELLNGDYLNAILELGIEGINRLVDNYITNGGGGSNKPKMIAPRYFKKDNRIDWNYDETKELEGYTGPDEKGWYINDTDPEDKYHYLHYLDILTFITDGKTYDPNDETIASYIFLRTVNDVHYQNDDEVLNDPDFSNRITNLYNWYIQKYDTLVEDNLPIFPDNVWTAMQGLDEFQELLDKIPQEYTDSFVPNVKNVTFTFFEEPWEKDNAPAPTATFVNVKNPDAEIDTMYGGDTVKVSLTNWVPKYEDNSAVTTNISYTVDNGGADLINKYFIVPSSTEKNYFYLQLLRPLEGQVTITITYDNSPNTLTKTITLRKEV